MRLFAENMHAENPLRMRLFAENHLLSSKHSSVLGGIMRAHITTKPWKLAILLTLAPFYPPGDTKASQKWLLFVKAVFHKSKNKKDLLVGRRGSWVGIYAKV